MAWSCWKPSLGAETPSRGVWLDAVDGQASRPQRAPISIAARSAEEEGRLDVDQVVSKRLGGRALWMLAWLPRLKSGFLTTLSHGGQSARNRTSASASSSTAGQLHEAREAATTAAAAAAAAGKGVRAAAARGGVAAPWVRNRYAHAWSTRHLRRI